MRKWLADLGVRIEFGLLASVPLLGLLLSLKSCFG